MKLDFDKVRVLAVGSKGYAAVMLRTVLNAAGLFRLELVEEPRRALELLCSDAFDVVFIEENLQTGGHPFALAARRNKAVVNPLVPIFLIAASPRRLDVEQSRDHGISDVLVRPLSAALIVRKLSQILTQPRPFIAAPTFFGPDRRAKTRNHTFSGPDRRVRTPRKATISVGG